MEAGHRLAGLAREPGDETPHGVVEMTTWFERAWPVLNRTHRFIGSIETAQGESSRDLGLRISGTRSVSAIPDGNPSPGRVREEGLGSVDGRMRGTVRDFGARFAEVFRSGPVLSASSSPVQNGLSVVSIPAVEGYSMVFRASSIESRFVEVDRERRLACSESPGRKSIQLGEAVGVAAFIAARK
jgi:hypothetical protein